MVPPASHRVSRVRWYSGYCCVKILFAYRAVTYYGVSSHTLLLKILNHVMQSATPKVLLPSVWPLSLSLAATKKIDVSFSSSAYLDVSVQRVSPRRAMYLPYDDCAGPQPGFPIRKSADQGIFAPPRSLSQLITSFFGS